MAYGRWNVLTTGYTTTVTAFGVAGYWRQMRDEFPPIDFVGTTTPTYPANGPYAWYGSTTPGPSYSVQMEAQKITSYIRGTRWVRFDQAPETNMNSAMYGYVTLQYRAVNEYGQGDVPS